MTALMVSAALVRARARGCARKPRGGMAAGGPRGCRVGHGAAPGVRRAPRRPGGVGRGQARARGVGGAGLGPRCRNTKSSSDRWRGRFGGYLPRAVPRRPREVPHPT